MKAKRSDFTVKLSLWVLSVQAFKEFTQILFQICLTPWKKILLTVNHSALNCMKSLLITLFNVT